VLAHRQDRYFHQAPGPQDVVLVIEVSHNTWAYDHVTKLPIYQQAGIPEIWLVDVQQRLLLSYARISGHYDIRRYQQPDDVITCSRLPDIQVRLGDLFFSDRSDVRDGR
jgi:Uma2 family endonuclease